MKPDVILFYNATKGGVDCLDQMLIDLTCKRGTCKWTMVIFMFMLDAAEYNAYVLCKQRKKDLNRRKSLEKLALNLIRPFIEIRAQKIVENDYRGISTDIQKSIRKVGVELPKKESFKEAPKAVIQRCSACPRHKDKKSRVSCARCDEFVCNDHSKSFRLCNGCYNEIHTLNDEEKRAARPYNLRK